MRRLLCAGLLAIASTLAAGQSLPPQTTSAQARLDAIIQQIIARGGRGGGAASDPSALLTDLRSIDARSLAPASDVDRRFAESILVGRQLAAERHDGPMGGSGVHAHAARAVPPSLRRGR